VRLEITRVEGIRNDLVLKLERDEIDGALLSVAGRERLMALPGMPRHRTATTSEQQAIADVKLSIQQHLEQLEIVDESGRARRRAVAIANRNLGINHGHVAWQRTASPSIFRIAEDPCDYESYSCLAVWRRGGLSIEDLRFDFDGQRILRAADGRDLSDEIEWATFGQRVLRAGVVARIDAIAGQFYDARHVLAFDHHRPTGEDIRRSLYARYPEGYADAVLRAWCELGVPRARYVHGALGLSAGQVIIVQREGTIEEIGDALRAAGADDGVILDNGGSVVCWVWWANLYAGGIVSPTVDYHPPGTSAIAFVLKGPATIDLPGGSVSYSVS